MGDLHAIAYRTTTSSLAGVGGWDLHDLAAGGFPSPVSENTPPFFSYLDSDDLSTGYLEDALFKFSSKRRRLLLISQSWIMCLVQRCLDNGNTNLNCFENYDCLSQITKCDSLSGEGICKSGSRMSTEETSFFTEMKRNNPSSSDEEAISALAAYQDYSSSSSRKLSADKPAPPPTVDPPSSFSAGSEEERRRRKRVVSPPLSAAKLVYPFAVVKPGGKEGDVTLNDINERILMPPTRPVKHPVGDFACRPLVSRDGPGLSGKAVVALTRIQTQGRGTITIIRTRG
nr:protein XRI1-like [Ipomoea batatas]